jgi:hypothetical protein
MQKLLIRVTPDVVTRLGEKLTYHYGVHMYTRDGKIVNIICVILAKVRRKWTTICMFVPNENLDDILTMFRVNLELKIKRA